MKDCTYIAFISDNHVKATCSEEDREETFRRALECCYKAAPELDAIVSAGDLTDDGFPGQFKYYMEILNEYLKPETTFTACMGNHEWYFWGWGANILANNATAEFRQRFTDGTGLAPDSDTVVNGIHIICVSADNENTVFHPREEYLREHIAAAAEEDPEKPIFLVAHLAPADTVIYTKDPVTGSSEYLAADWSPEFLQFLDNYPQLIYMSGHTHYTIADPRSIYRGKYTIINCGCTKATPSQGLLAEIDNDTGKVIIHRLDFTNDKALDEGPWII